MIGVITISVKVAISLIMIVIFYSPESKDIEEDLESTVGRLVKGVFFMCGFGYLILNIWQIFGIEMTEYTRFFKQIFILGIMGSVYLYVKRFKQG